jgi:glucose-1-phosphatase
MTSPNAHIRVVLFDIGGVLVEPSGIPTMLSWMGHRVSPEELFKMWLASPVVRAFETGRTTPEVFAGQLIAEMSMAVEKQTLLQEFAAGARLFPGALDLIDRIPRTYTRATLANSNALHWPRLMNEMQLASAFDHHFASHLTGKIKPDENAFQHVIDTLKCGANEILFLDDNQLNVDAATKLGMNAFQAKGISAAERILLHAGVIDDRNRRPT